jgi:uncharacterized protein (TIGR00725 family)
VEQVTVKKPEPEKRISIAVIGGGKCTPQVAALAETVGRELAKRGVILICGGRSGVMEAACKGARQESGMTIGILPHDDPAAANPYVQIPIATGIGYARNIAVVNSADAVIAVGGNYGTLTEIAYALKSGIPVIGLHTWSLFRNGMEEAALIRAEDAVEAVEKAIAMARRLFRLTAE